MADNPRTDSTTWPSGRGWRVREFHEADIEQVIALCEATRELPDSAPISLVHLIAALRASQPAVVAICGDDLIGFAVTETTDDRARLLGFGST